MKKLPLFLLLVSLLLSLCACVGSGTSGTGKPLYGIVLSSDDPFQQKILEGYRDAVSELGGEVIVAENDGTVDGQIQAIDSLIEKSACAIALRPADTSGLENALSRAKKAGIPVITVDSDTADSPLFLQHGDPAAAARAMLDAIYDLTGGVGEFAVVADDLFSGTNQWVHAMEYAIRDENYSGLVWAETVYSVGDPAVYTNLVQKYPGLQVICCPYVSNLADCCRALESAESKIKVTGLGRPSLMDGLVGTDKNCPCFFLWDPVKIGSSAAYLLHAMEEGQLGDPDTSFTAKNGESYTISSGMLGEKCVVVDTLIRFDETNADQWTEIY